MRIYIFILLEVSAFIFIMNFLKIILFYHFPNKIKFNFKVKKLPPLFRKRKINKLIKKLNFKYIGVRKEKIFKVLSVKYYLYKNDKNIYLDINKSGQFFYFSYFKEKVFMLYPSNLKFKEFKNELIEVLNYKDQEFELAEDIKREKISEIFYQNVKLLPTSMRLFTYFILTFFLIQFVVLFIKWF